MIKVIEWSTEWKWSCCSNHNKPCQLVVKNYEKYCALNNTRFALVYTIIFVEIQNKKTKDVEWFGESKSKENYMVWPNGLYPLYKVFSGYIFTI